jgi:hypothetical protein
MEKIMVIDQREIGGSRSEGSKFEIFMRRKKLRVETPETRSPK